LRKRINFSFFFFFQGVYEPFGILQAKIAFYTFNGVTKSRGWAILDFPNEASRQEAE